MGILSYFKIARGAMARGRGIGWADLLQRINGLGIGPQGFGGVVTALAVNIEVYPTHIAGLPAAVNLAEQWRSQDSSDLRSAHVVLP